MNDVLYDKNNKNERSEEDSDDIWDDTALLKAWDKAINKAAKDLSQGEGSDEQTKKPKPKKKQWQAGSHCRAVYSEDGVEYEAVVDQLVSNKKCIVRYLGYENSEEVNFNSLKPSLGKKAIDKQIAQSKIDIDAFNRAKMSWNTTPPLPMINQSPTSNPPSVAGCLPPPPPPGVISNFPKDESDALSAMLMAWYMSGFHTGYYHGVTQSKKAIEERLSKVKRRNRRNSKNKH